MHLILSNMEFEREKAYLFETILPGERITSREVLEAMKKIPREAFVPKDQKPFSYQNRPLSIGREQTISQPYIVALMSELARIKPGDKVLEIGTGCGYQTAVLAGLGAKVYTIERIEELALKARSTLKTLELHKNVEFKTGDGYLGWPEFAPFDSIVVTACPDEIPKTLCQQLKVGGRLISPEGKFSRQTLFEVLRTSKGFEKRPVCSVQFVPLLSGSNT